MRDGVRGAGGGAAPARARRSPAARGRRRGGGAAARDARPGVAGVAGGRAGAAGGGAAAPRTRASTRWTRDQRARLLEALGRAGPPGVAALDGVKALLLLAWGGHSHAEEIDGRRQRATAGARRTVGSTSATAPSCPRASPATRSSSAPAPGVRSPRASWPGPGASVLVLEEGERWDVERLRATPGSTDSPACTAAAGPPSRSGMPPVVLPVGRAVGGTTVVNSGTCYRPPEQRGEAVARRPRAGAGRARRARRAARRDRGAARGGAGAARGDGQQRAPGAGRRRTPSAGTPRRCAATLPAAGAPASARSAVPTTPRRACI